MRRQPDDGRGLVLFIHGLWMSASSWDPWAEEFDDNGYDSISYRWPGETRDPGRPSAFEGARLRRLAGQLTSIVGSLDQQPIAIGSGIGGLLAQALVQQGSASAAISLAPAPSGLAAATAGLRLVWSSPRLAWAATRSPVVRSLIRPATPPRREAAERRGPLLLTAAGRDQVIHEASVGALHRRYRRRQPGAVTDYKVFPDREHSFVVDPGWPAVAYYCLDWLTANGL